MSATEILAEHGFANAAVVNTSARLTVCRIRTAKGWTYEKFVTASLAAEIAAWAARHEPEPAS